MSRPNRRIAWVFAAGAAVVLAIGGLRLLSAWRGAPAPAEAGDSGLVASTDARTGDAAALANLARRVRTLRDNLNRTRSGLQQAERQSADLRERVAVLDDMLARDTLTDCPIFLHEETTVRALQSILREATESRVPAAGRMATGEMIARQRLRQRLTLLRDEMDQQARDLDARADVLRADLRRQADELAGIEQGLMSRLPTLPGK
ncbi:MAG: hypothetical protein WBD63_09630 [Phycisphaerae bacterium]|nr:hypothetical protein [Phycisphaerae bacterium]